MHYLCPYSACDLQEASPRVPSSRYRVSSTLVSTPSGRLISASSNCLQKAINYLHLAQQPGGGWVGSWGICFTYAAQFALESLSLVGETYETSEYSKKGCEFLLKHQREDGGWGESWEVQRFL